LHEAVQLIQAALKAGIKIEDWKEAAIRALNLTELYLMLGNISEAIALAEQGVYYADRSGDMSVRRSTRATSGTAWHEAGEHTRAEALFQEAERLQAEWQPQYPQLYSQGNYRYCNLLLDLGRQAEVRERTAQTLQWFSKEYPLLDIALAQDGAPLALRLLRSFFPAMWGFALFCLVVAVAMLPLGPGPAFLLALAVQMAVHGVVLWRMIRVG
jgi:tetratricopeptide (TPR) repeat protein